MEILHAGPEGTPEGQRADYYSSDVAIHEALWEGIQTKEDALALITELMQRFDKLEGLYPSSRGGLYANPTGGHRSAFEISSWVELAHHLACDFLEVELMESDDRIAPENENRERERRR